MVVSKKKLGYEECRLKRLEENKKRMEELNLNKLALALRTATTLKASPKMKPRTLQQPLLPVRKSSRVAGKPPVSYKDLGRYRKCKLCKKGGHYKNSCPGSHQQATDDRDGPNNNEVQVDAADTGDRQVDNTMSDRH